MMLKGCDLSHNNSAVDFHAMVAEGLSFVYLKATQGSGFVDPMYHELKERAQSVGLLVGAYHYFTPTHDAAAQAEHFAAAVGSLAGMLPPMLDAELDSNQRAGVDPRGYVDSMLAWLSCAKTKTRGPVGVYSYGDFWSFLNSPTQFGTLGYLQWCASYGHPAPRQLAGWNHWDFWQYSDQGTAGGCHGVDLDAFNGSLSNLKALVAKE